MRRNVLLIFACFAALLSSTIMAGGMVFVHINEHTTLCRHKDDLIKESGYFKTMFIENHKAVRYDIHGVIKLTMGRNEQSMRAVWDFLTYGKILETDPSILYRMKLDAQFLQIESLLKALEAHDATRIDKQLARTKKAKIFVAWHNGSQEDRVKKLQKKLDKFFGYEDTSAKKENALDEEFTDDEECIEEKTDREIISINKAQFIPEGPSYCGTLTVSVMYWEGNRQ